MTIIGATGIQGGSVVDAMIQHTDFKIRAVTRDRNSTTAKTLASRGIEVVEANLDDATSLQAAFEGSYAIYAMTNYFESMGRYSEEECIDIESRQGINLAKAASATPTLAQYIWSSLPNSRENSGGKIVIPYYEAKNKVTAHIKSDAVLLPKTTFLWITWYATNLQYPFYKPFPITTAGPNQFIQLQASPANVPMKVIGDPRVNVGLFVKAILEQPEKTLPGRTVLAATDDMTAGELLSTWAKVHGKEARFVQINNETYNNLWPMWGELMHKTHSFWELAGEKTFSGEDVILTKDDLNLTGLVDAAATLAKLDL